MVKADTNRPIRANFLKVERRISGVVFQPLKIPSGYPLSGFRQLGKIPPEILFRPMH